MPSQGPVEFERSRIINENIRKEEQYQDNVSTGLRQSRAAQEALDETIDRLIEIKGNLVQGATGTSNSQVRETMAREIEGIRDTLVNTLNVSSGDRYLFAGTNSDTIPFELKDTFADVAGADIGGAAGSEITEIQITDSDGTSIANATGLTIDTSTVDATSMQAIVDEITALGVNGLTANVNGTNDGIIVSNSSSNEQYTVEFTGDFNGDGIDTQTSDTGEIASPGDVQNNSSNANPKDTDAGDVFGIINNIIDALDADDTNALSQLLTDADTAIEHVSNQAAKIGTNINRMDFLFEQYESSKIAQRAEISNLVDTDYAETFSDLQRNQIAYESAMAVHSTMFSNTLLDYL
jgi:flagellar hook-associated protein 3